MRAPRQRLRAPSAPRSPGAPRSTSAPGATALAILLGLLVATGTTPSARAQTDPEPAAAASETLNEDACG
ncbi:MAG: chromosomal replication initiator protein DnaA, partial [Pseudomonadota bacterium]